MGTKRSENYCENCGNTWFPRGKALSARCPSCKSERVTFTSLRNRSQPVSSPQPIAPVWHPPAPPSRMSGLTKAVIAIVCVGAVMLVVAVVAIVAVADRLPKKKTEQPVPQRPTKR